MNTESAGPRPTLIEESIFHVASDLKEPQTRAAFLDRACGSDAALRARIESLLAAALRAEHFLSNDPLDLVPPKRPAPGRSTVPEPSDGDRIGHYKLLERIGEGGMGVVYMAEQEHPVRRKVALKIVKLGMDTRQVVARFEAERQALALMNHPNIAQVLDAGATETGRPYFVMELVQGAPITEFCAANKLSTVARLQLFATVCRAVQSAHQKGVIHRDIKPSNVLVTMHNSVPHPVVIDFGVAKAIDQKLTEKTLFTNFATMIGTPAYMSPEQAEMSRLDVDTRSDIYSLGVLLYELLTGSTPFPVERLRSVAYGEMQRIIVEEEPDRPSTRLRKLATVKSDIQHRTPPIDSDLDWIVMKCLEKDRDRRYETANGLAADLERHLGGEPVVARPPSAIYRFQKLVWRHKTQFAAAMFALNILLVAAAVSAWQAVKARRAEAVAMDHAQIAAAQAKVASQQTAIARSESENAQAATAFLIDMLLGVDCCGATPDGDALTFEATQALARKVALRIEGKLTNQPLAEANIRMELAKVFIQARNFGQGAAQAEKALAIRSAALGANDSNTLAAVIRLAVPKYHLGQRQEAFDLLTNAIAGARAGGRASYGGLAGALGEYGNLLALEGRASEALPCLHESAALMRLTHDPKSIQIKAVTARIIDATRLGGDPARAELLTRELLEQARTDHGPDHYFTAETAFALGRMLVGQQRWQEALPLLERSLALKRAQLGVNHFSTLSAQLHLGEAYEQKGDIQAASLLYADLHPRYARHLPYWSAAYSCAEVARFFVRHRRYEEAKLAFGTLRDSYDAKPPEHPLDFDRLIDATAPTRGWAEVAKVYRNYQGRFAREAAFQRSMASALLYADDREGYRRAVTNALQQALTATNIDEQRRFVDLVGLGPAGLTANEIHRCGLLLSLDRNSAAWDRPVAALLLRLGRHAGAIQRLDRALDSQPSTSERARLLMLKAISLGGSGDAENARATFDQAERLMREPLLNRLPNVEGFIDHDERTFLILRREALALLTAAGSD